MEIFVSAISSPIVVALVAILGAFSVQRYVAFGNASITFRKTVLEIFTGLYPVPSDWPIDGNSVDRKLQSIFPALQTTVSTFRESLPFYSRRGFDRAWFIYLHGSDGSDRNHYYQYMGYSSPDVKIPDSKATFQANVERLLSYAKET